jgi:hypothetical protein
MASQLKFNKLIVFHRKKNFRCGSRGGYYELINVDKDVRLQVNKLISASLCSTAWGQAVMGAIINPPKEGEPSYELYKQERSTVLNRLKEKADLVSQLFNSVEGVRCNTVMGLVNEKRIFYYLKNKSIILVQCMHFQVLKFLKKRLNMRNQKI